MHAGSPTNTDAQPVTPGAPPEPPPDWVMLDEPDAIAPDSPESSPSARTVSDSSPGPPFEAGPSVLPSGERPVVRSMPVRIEQALLTGQLAAVDVRRGLRVRLAVPEDNREGVGHPILAGVEADLGVNAEARLVFFEDGSARIRPAGGPDIPVRRDEPRKPYEKPTVTRVPTDPGAPLWGGGFAVNASDFFPELELEATAAFPVLIQSELHPGDLADVIMYCTALRAAPDDPPREGTYMRAVAQSAFRVGRLSTCILQEDGSAILTIPEIIPDGSPASSPSARTVSSPSSPDPSFKAGPPDASPEAPGLDPLTAHLANLVDPDWLADLREGGPVHVPARAPAPAVPATRDPQPATSFAVAVDDQCDPALRTALMLPVQAGDIICALLEIEADLPPLCTWPDLLRLTAEILDLAHCPTLQRAASGEDLHPATALAGSLPVTRHPSPVTSLSPDARLLGRFLIGADGNLDALAALEWDSDRTAAALREALEYGLAELHEAEADEIITTAGPGV